MAVMMTMAMLAIPIMLTLGASLLRWYELGRQDFHAMEGTGTGFGRIRLAITWWPVQLLQSNLGSGLPETDASLAASATKVQHSC